MAKTEKNYDLVIIGAGPGGLTAAVYAARYKLNALVIGKLPGGLISEAWEVCNFPSYEKIKGIELGMKMVQQVRKFGVEIKGEEVLSIEKGKTFKIKTNSNTYEGKKVLIATGTERKRLGVKGENEFKGRGVTYCATCDSAFYKDKTVAVAGGSDAALTAALLLSEYAKKVYIVYRKDKYMKAEPAWVELVEKNKKIESVFNSNIIEIYGKERVQGIKLDTKKELKVDGLFIEIGSVPDERLSKQLGLASENGYIIVDKKQETNVPGVYAAGDITNNVFKQVIVACSEGAIAAKSAYDKIIRGE